ncbi:MAG: hypothetical protein O3B47_03945, partial [bacterium]|nr:hypothetical protein [bacterium]
MPTPALPDHLEETMPYELLGGTTLPDHQNPGETQYPDIPGITLISSDELRGMDMVRDFARLDKSQQSIAYMGFKSRLSLGS